MMESYRACQIEDFVQDPEWPIEVVQISPGPLFYNLTIQSFGSTSLQWIASNAAMHVHDHYLGPSITFGFIVGGDGPQKFLGADLAEGEAVVWRSGSAPSYEYVTPTNLSAFIVRVPEATAERLGWSSILPRRMMTIRSEFIALRQYAEALAMRATAPTQDAEATLIAMVEAAFGDQLFSHADQHACAAVPLPLEIVRRALVHLSEPDVDSTRRVDEVCRMIGVPRRSLYRAFRQTIGLGPARYARLRRQNDVRMALLRSFPGTDTVTRIAQDHGFFHPDRFAREYRELFGERPSRTLARSGEERATVA